MGGGDPRDLSDACLGHPDRVDRVALRTSTQTVTFGELQALVEDEARTLTRAGKGPGDVVAIVANDVRTTIVQVLAAWHARLVVLPLDPAMPAASREALTNRAAARAAPPGAALILFTSGSSGPPKGVLLSASGLLHNVRAILAYLPVQAAGRVGLCSPLFYSYGLVGQALVTLVSGAELVDLVSLPSPQAQIDLIREVSVRGISSVPTHLRKLVFVLAEKARTLPLAFCGVAGATLDPPTRALVRERFEGAEIFHQYGLTEAAPRVTAISSHDPRFEQGSVGKALVGMRIEVRDAEGVTLSHGTEGEVHVHSPSVMLGYHDDEEATARAIGADGFLRTGDRGHLDDEGYLYVAGRADGVVKCGGERVSLENVASVVRAAPGVAEAEVVAVPHAELGHALVAFVEPEVSVGPLRAALRDRLSPAQRPSKVVAMAALPRTSNGKIARSELETLARGAS